MKSGVSILQISLIRHSNVSACEGQHLPFSSARLALASTLLLFASALLLFASALTSALLLFASALIPFVFPPCIATFEFL